MNFKEKKQEIKEDVFPFLISIPIILWLNWEIEIGLPVLMAVMIPVFGYIAFVIMNLIGYWLWKI